MLKQGKLIGLKMLLKKIKLILKKKLKNICGQLNFECKILYGGGVDLNSYKQIRQANVDGFLLGGICLNIDESISLINEVENE